MGWLDILLIWTSMENNMEWRMFSKVKVKALSRQISPSPCPPDAPPRWAHCSGFTDPQSLFHKPRSTGSVSAKNQTFAVGLPVKEANSPTHTWSHALTHRPRKHRLRLSPCSKRCFADYSFLHSLLWRLNFWKSRLKRPQRKLKVEKARMQRGKVRIRHNQIAGCKLPTNHCNATIIRLKNDA